MALAVEAPAKVNLGLVVLGRRADGYHEIETRLHALEFADTLTAELGPAGIDLRLDRRALRTGLPVDAGPDNLVCRAAAAFFRRLERPPGCRFHLTKRVPAGAGLGGGSSDAAAALRLLNALTGHPLDAAALHGLAAGLGADVPFFLGGGTQLAQGVGDKLTAVADPPRQQFILILPEQGTSTRAVYKNFGAQWTIARPQARFSPDKVPDVEETAVPMAFPNDLEAAAFRLYPDLAELR